MSEVITTFGEKGVTSEAVARAVSEEVQAFQAAADALGPHLADQWMLPLALAVADRNASAAYSCTEMTDHSTTNIGVIEAFLPVRFNVVESGPGLWHVTIAPSI